MLISLLSGCSAYESDGRKYLERQGLEFAGVAAQQNLLSCNHEAPLASWMQLDQSESATLYALEGAHFDLAVQSRIDPTFSCTYHFASTQEMYEKTKAAIALTVLNQSLGEFAFHRLSHLK